MTRPPRNEREAAEVLASNVIPLHRGWVMRQADEHGNLEVVRVPCPPAEPIPADSRLLNLLRDLGRWLMGPRAF